MTNLRKSFDVYCKFLGFRYDEAAKECVRTDEFQLKARNWLSAGFGPNHNWLRCSRVLHCLRLVEETERRDAFYFALEKVYEEGLIGAEFANTVQFWQKYGGIEGRPVPRQKRPA
eukprot:TRINITY_DN27028_c0_g1_i1.p1 TRINITY_DN27028_c0_g1~~TRINITY_DN27028_c0_g1_i1.p1  ORF type:complete len:115 (-),score=24.29 TRINITY_DN27028_c0_g1_i1:103-447(-)